MEGLTEKSIEIARSDLEVVFKDWAAEYKEAWPLDVDNKYFDENYPRECAKELFSRLQMLKD